MNNNVNWLVTCPSNDGNFKLHLEYASAEEVREALHIIIGQHNTKTKEKNIACGIEKKGAVQEMMRKEKGAVQGMTREEAICQLEDLKRARQ